MSTARHHAEWLSLIEVSGPFLSMPVLLRVFPQGLDAHDPERFRLLRAAYEEWEDNQEGRRPDPAIHNAWIRFILTGILGLPEDCILEGQGIPQSLYAGVPEHGETLRPSLVIKNPANGPDAGKPRILVHTYPSGQDLDKRVEGKTWQASPGTRMMELLHATGVRLGLVTNGQRWMLVDAPRNETTGFASWYASLWLEEPITLRAFASLLGTERLWGVAAADTLEAILAESASNQQEVTDQLGYQVRRAVEVLVQSLDLADRTHGGKLLENVPETTLYEAALTVMMRLVFLFCAEERRLFPIDSELYARHYAASTLREQLRKTADDHGEEILERRNDAWTRLLAAFRLIHGGSEHPTLRLPAYGGHLFDPDRFPFLEGRLSGTTYTLHPASPVPVNNRTVLHLLEALQLLEVKVPGSAEKQARRLSFRALDIEQIGHVYEGLLDHTARRATEPMLGLAGTRDKEPEIPLARLEELSAKGEDALVEFLKDHTGRSVPALKRVVRGAEQSREAWSVERGASDPPTLHASRSTLHDPSPTLHASRATLHASNRLLAVCGSDPDLLKRIQPFAALIREDTFGYPVVVKAGSVFVTAGTDRRSSGTHYTPRSLTEPIVQYTLEPLVYTGPAEGKPKEEWKLRPPAELLDLKICDMACGSGAFLVQACRYMSERLVEAWESVEREAWSVERATEENRGACGVERGASDPLTIHAPRATHHDPSPTSHAPRATLHEGVPHDRTELPRSGGVAGGDGPGGTLLHGNQAIPEGGNVRADQSDSPSGGIDSSEHRRGTGQAAHRRAFESPEHRPRLADGTGDASATGLPGTSAGSAVSGGPFGLGNPSQSDAGQAASIAPARLIPASHAPRSTRHAPRSPISVPRILPDGRFSTGAPGEQLVPNDPDERLAYARRLVAQRCLYGVDINPLAAEMAKLSLWLLTLAKDRPFTFLDHAIRCGDSLIGLSANRIAAFHWDDDHEPEFEVGFIHEKVKRAIAYRSKILTSAELATHADKEQMLAVADEALEFIRFIADLIVAAHFSSILETGRVDRRDKLLTALRDYRLKGDPRLREPLTQAVAGLQNGHGRRLRPFHWEIEFPEVFLRDNPGFDAVIGNPPFQGGQRITGALGTEYRAYLVDRLACGRRGSADLCAYFFLRAVLLLRRNGQSGLLATNTIAQGDTREVGLDQLAADGCKIVRAVPSRPWPGAASLEVAHVWLRRGTWYGPCFLDEQSSSGITPFLTAPSTVSGKPHRLKANEHKSFQGSIVLGMGFVLDPEEARQLIDKDPRNKDVLFPYLNGEDLNSRPDQSPSRWVINFFDWPMEKAMTYPDCFHIVEEKVKPERITNKYSKTAREAWWLYERWRPELYEAIKNCDTVLATTRVTKYLSVSMLPNTAVFSVDLAVHANSSMTFFCCTSCTIFDAWTRETSSTMETRLRFSITDSLETFPFPATGGQAHLQRIGSAYTVHRKHLLQSREEGLTAMYNRFHDPGATVKDIQALRDLHVEMDKAVAAAYGWDDLDLGHDFHETKQGVRFTISETARREVLARLLRLNHERYAEEVAQGLHEKKRGAKSVKRGAGGVKRAAKEGPGTVHALRTTRHDPPATSDQPLLPGMDEPEETHGDAQTSSDGANASRSTPHAPRLDYFDYDELIQAIRAVAGREGELPRDDFIVAVARELGFLRTGHNIRETVNGAIRAAARRGIVATGPFGVAPAKVKIEDWTRDDLVDLFPSVMKAGVEYDREDVIKQAATHIGFKRVGKNVDEAFRSAINGAIRREVLKYRGNVVWRD